MELFQVFISSVIGPEVDDLAEERRAVCSAVAQFPDVAKPWVFEDAPASSQRLADYYLDEVKRCDLFLLIVGRCVTKQVRAECQTALDYERPMLVFRKEVANREPSVEDFLRSLDVKYDSFSDARNLEALVRRGLGQELLSRIRDRSVARDSRVHILAALRRAMREKRNISISPIVPASPNHVFVIEKVGPENIEINNSALMRTTSIPLRRVEDIFDTNQAQPLQLSLDGRLQWITRSQDWLFFTFKPPVSDALGVGHSKDHLFEDIELVAQLRKLGFKSRWSSRERLAEKLRRGYLVFFDDDGRSLESGDSRMVFVVAPDDNRL